MVRVQLLPIYSLFMLKKTTKTHRRVTVVINLPCRIQNIYSVCVVEDGLALQLKVQIPSVMNDAETLHELCLGRV